MLYLSGLAFTTPNHFNNKFLNVFMMNIGRTIQTRFLVSVGHSETWCKVLTKNVCLDGFMHGVSFARAFTIYGDLLLTSSTWTLNFDFSSKVLLVLLVYSVI